MKTQVISACAIEEDDWFFLAGILYRVDTVTRKPSGKKVRITFHNPDQKHLKTPQSSLKLDIHIPMQILNQ